MGYANSGGAVHIVKREAEAEAELIQRPGTDMPDTIHTPTDTDTDIDTLTMHIHMPTVPTDILIPTEDIITENRFSDEYRISDMAKRARVPDHLTPLIKQHNLPS